MDQRKKKIYTILLIGSGMVLFVNYVLFPAEDTRRLAVVDATTVGLKSVSASIASVNVDAIPALVFPRDLPSWPPEGRARDIFTSPFETVDGQQAHPAVSSGPVTPTQPDRIGRKMFADKHSLQMILDDKQRSIAVVSDKWLSLGDEIDQCKLLAVKGTVALFECYDGKVLLELDASPAK